MQNTYNPIAAQVAKLENAKRSNLFLQNMSIDYDHFENEGFVKVFDSLKEKFEITYELLGDANFKTLVLSFLKTNPVQSAKSEKFGKNFPEFLGSVPEMKSFYFIKYIAMLDWFWFITDSPRDTIRLPKGTLHSWGSVARGEDAINIMIDESEVEILCVQKNGKEYSIVQKS